MIQENQRNTWHEQWDIPKLIDGLRAAFPVAGTTSAVSVVQQFRKLLHDFGAGPNHEAVAAHSLKVNTLLENQPGPLNQKKAVEALTAALIEAKDAKGVARTVPEYNLRLTCASRTASRRPGA